MIFSSMFFFNGLLPFAREGTSYDFLYQNVFGYKESTQRELHRKADKYPSEYLRRVRKRLTKLLSNEAGNSVGNNLKFSESTLGLKYAAKQLRYHPEDTAAFFLMCNLNIHSGNLISEEWLSLPFTKYKSLANQHPIFALLSAEDSTVMLERLHRDPDILSWPANDSAWESIARLQVSALLIYFVIWSLSLLSIPSYKSQGPTLLRIDDYLKTSPKPPNWLDFVFWRVGAEHGQPKSELQKSLADALYHLNPDADASGTADAEHYLRNIRRWLKNRSVANTQSQQALIKAFSHLGWPVWVGDTHAQSTYELFSMLTWTQNAIDLNQVYEEQYGHARQYILKCTQVIEPILHSLPREAEKVRAYAGPV